MIQFVLCSRSVSYITGFLSMCKQTLMATARFAYPRRQARLTGVRVNAQLLRDITICTRETPVALSTSRAVKDADFNRDEQLSS